jgi:hypothetical protein
VTGNLGHFPISWQYLHHDGRLAPDHLLADKITREIVGRRDGCDLSLAACTSIITLSRNRRTAFGDVFQIAGPIGGGIENQIGHQAAEQGAGGVVEVIVPELGVAVTRSDPAEHPP